MKLHGITMDWFGKEEEKKEKKRNQMPEARFIATYNNRENDVKGIQIN